METLFIERTDTTPKVLLDPENLEFVINGKSLLSNGKAFYDPILKWIEDFEKQLPNTSTPLSIEVKLKEHDQESLDILGRFFGIVGRMHSSGLRVLIDWFLVDQEFSKEVGQELSDDSGLPFNFVEE